MKKKKTTNFAEYGWIEYNMHSSITVFKFALNWEKKTTGIWIKLIGNYTKYVWMILNYISATYYILDEI